MPKIKITSRDIFVSLPFFSSFSLSQNARYRRSFSPRSLRWRRHRLHLLDGRAEGPGMTITTKKPISKGAVLLFSKSAGARTIKSGRCFSRDWCTHNLTKRGMQNSPRSCAPKNLFHYILCPRTSDDFIPSHLLDSRLASLLPVLSRLTRLGDRLLSP